MITTVINDKLFYLSLDKNISVIIPVFNAATFVEKAVESALLQPETLEVILIEDGSSDDSLLACKHMEARHDKVRFLTHPGNVNKGVGASRNLGIAHALGEFIAFLDADDYYLPNRFIAERTIFQKMPETDGVYGALGFHYYSENGKKKFVEQGYGELTTLSGKVPSSELFLSLLWLHVNINGHFSVDTLTIKKNVFSKGAELFNELKFHEDTVFIIQLALTCKLEAGLIDAPVAIRGVHDNNTITSNSADSHTRVLMWERLFFWVNNSPKKDQLSNLFHLFLMKAQIFDGPRIKGFVRLIYFSFQNRDFLQERLFFNPVCLHVFGKYLGNHLILLKERLLKGAVGALYKPSEKLLKTVQ